MSVEATKEWIERCGIIPVLRAGSAREGHALVEALVAGRLAKKRGLSPGGWRLQTFVVGFPSLLSLRRATRTA